MVFRPNGNTFKAWIAGRAPELNLNLPRRAVGGNYVKKCQEKENG